MIAKIIALDLMWMTILILIGQVLHTWTQIVGIRKVTVYSTSAIVAAIICSYPWLI